MFEFEIVNIIIIITLIIIIYKYFEAQSYDIIMVKSNVNNKSYLVRNVENKQEAADLLGAIAVKLEKLVNIMTTSGYEVIYDKYMKKTVDKETEIDKSNTDQQKDTIAGQDGGTSEGQQLTNNIKHKLKGYKTGVEFKSKLVDFDPYIIGLWLGDGSSSSAKITSQVGLV
mgnify:CR=1 FL=1